MKLVVKVFFNFDTKDGVVVPVKVAQNKGTMHLFDSGRNVCKKRQN